MSKLIKEVRSSIVGQAIGDFPNLSVKFDCNETVSFTYLKQYRLVISWEDIIQSDPEEFELVLTNFIRGFQEAIYGSLREKMIRLRQAVYEQKKKEIHEILFEMEKEMFEVET